MKNLFLNNDFKECVLRALAQKPDVTVNGCTQFDFGEYNSTLCEEHISNGITWDAGGCYGNCKKCKHFRTFTDFQQMAEFLLFEFSICKDNDSLCNRIKSNFNTFISLLVKHTQRVCYLTFGKYDAANLYTDISSSTINENIALLKFICDFYKENK